MRKWNTPWRVKRDDEPIVINRACPINCPGNEKKFNPVPSILITILVSWVVVAGVILMVYHGLKCLEVW